MNAQPLLFPLAIHPAKADLMAQIRALESRIAQLDEEKAGCQYQIDQYYRHFRIHLGDLLTQTVALQMQLSIQRAAKTGRRSDAEEARNWQDRFDQTNQAVREAIAHQPTDLAETDRRELRQLYRQAITLAHPDRYFNDPDRMAQATTFIARLNDAYQRQDLAAVRRLVQDLNNGLVLAPTAEMTHPLAALQQWHQRLTDRQTVLQLEIDQLKTTDAYQLITTGTDLAAHFVSLQKGMLQQIDHLKHQLHSS